ncbi:hypothetical protein P4B35_16900 [Pontiellaceae bacterium B12227]|nr:hypothetical protein [Pontiellaceae bacterium B12227]
MKTGMFVALVLVCTQFAGANEMFRLTATTHSETQNLSQVVADQFGMAASVADWENIKSAIAHDPERLQQFYELVGLRDEDEAICARNGAYITGSNRQYYLQRFDSGPYGGFLVHDQIGSLYLGSWYGLDMNVIASTTEEDPFKGFAITHDRHPVGENVEAYTDAYFGSAANVADWDDIKALVSGDPSALVEFYETVGLQDQHTAVCLRNGARFHSGDRQYFLNRFDSGPHAGFAVHDSVGTLYLGSWYGFSGNIIAERSANGIGPVAHMSQAVEIFWVGKSNATYQIEGVDSLLNTNWVAFGDPFIGDAGTNIILFSTRGTSNRYFRVQESE